MEKLNKKLSLLAYKGGFQLWATKRATFCCFKIDDLKRATKMATFPKTTATFCKNHLVTLAVATERSTKAVEMW